MNPIELKGALEAIIYAADEPATLDQIANAVGEEKATVRATLDEMIAAYAAEDRGVEVRAVAGGYKLYTKPQHHEVVRRFIKSLRPPLRLTMPALETLAVIAYRQPVTGPEIQEIRGVNVSGVVKTLLEKRLISTAGRKAVMGRPIMYRTSKEFLVRFGLSDLEELPSLKEFEQLARAALGADEGIAPAEPELLESPLESSLESHAEASSEAPSEAINEAQPAPDETAPTVHEIAGAVSAPEGATQDSQEMTPASAEPAEPEAVPPQAASESTPNATTDAEPDPEHTQHTRAESAS
jgi:segregation and condensation protein B